MTEGAIISVNYIYFYDFVNLYSCLFTFKYKYFCLHFQVTWFRQDEAIREDDRTIIKSTETQVGTYMVVLELDDVVESDAGLYKIKAKNTYGEVSASINLNFSRKLNLFLRACFKYNYNSHQNRNSGGTMPCTPQKIELD